MEPTVAPDHAPHRPISPPTVIALVAIAVGMGLRVIEFVRSRPLWLDEAMLALNIAGRPLGQLARPLDYDQTAPILYLWIERLAVVVGGVGERSLRVLPFVASMALVPLVWVIGRRMLGASAAVIATVLLALSVALVSFGSEAKQYGVDPLVTILVIGLAIRVLDRPDERRRWWSLTAGGIVALCLSQPAVFSLGAAALALALDPRVRQAPATGRHAAIAGLAWLLVFVGLYLGLYRATATSAYMRAFWNGTFLFPTAPDIAGRLRMFAFALFAAPTLSGSAGLSEWLLPIAWVAGLPTLFHRSRTAGVLCLTPIVLAALTSAVGMYPVTDRLFLFAAPVVALSFGSLGGWVVERVPERTASLVLAGCAGAIAIIGGPKQIDRIVHPVYYAVGKQVIADVDSMSRGEPVYIAARSFPLWMFYTTDWRNPDVDRLRWAASIAGAGAPAHNNAPSRGHVRADEARGLARSSHGRIEIVGLPTGRQYRTSTRTLDASIKPTELALPLEPDSGWAVLETDRMAAVAAAGRIWVFGSHMFSLDGAEAGLVAEMQRRGVHLVQERRQGSTVAYQVEFP